MRIIVSGPESSGKTTFSKLLSQQLNCPWVEEYAREYLSLKEGKYEFIDLEKIAQRQEQIQSDWEAQEGLIVCDTGLMVIKVWAAYKFDRSIPWLEQQWESRKKDYYILCKPDIPWEPDPLRENPTDRMKIYDIYKQNFDSLGLDYVSVGGSLEQRLTRSLDFLQSRIDII